MRAIPRTAVLVGLLQFTSLLLFTAEPAEAAITGLERLASGLDFPVFATHAPGDPNRLFIVEKGEYDFNTQQTIKPGRIKILDLANGGITGTFLTIDDTDAQGEGGLVGMAFHPDYNNAGTDGYGKLYVYVTVDNGGVVSDGVTSPFSAHVREYSVMSGNPNLADPASEREILNIVRPRDFHVSGWIGFNPEITPGEPQYLYITSGDAGPQGDPNNHAQTITNQPLGKVLRVDVDSDTFPDDATRNYAIPDGNPFEGPTTGDDEIWAYGLRNPWRASFDRDTGDYWIGDVGFNTREEINRQDAGTTAVANFGWNQWEGTEEYQADPDVYPPNYVGPVYDYAHGNTPMTGNSVVGGYVYRGPDPDLAGKYVFGDSWNGGNVWTFDPDDPNGTVTNIDSQLTPDAGVMDFPVAFGEDAGGNLYIVDYFWTAGTGEIYRIVTDALLAGDYNANGTVDAADYALWRDTLGSTSDLRANGDNTGASTNIIDEADYAVWREHFGDSVHALGAGSGAGGAVVPEPAAAAMALQLLCLLPAGAWYNRRRRKSSRAT